MKHDVTGRAGSPASTFPAAGTPAGGGWHWAPWACEFLGTAILLGGGLSAVFVDFGPSSPVARQVPSMSARLLLTGLLFAGTGSLVAPSPLGRRGAHLNPAVTLAFWTQRKVHPHDLVGYIAAQLLAALAAGAALRLAWAHTARTLHLGATPTGPRAQRPRRGRLVADAITTTRSCGVGGLMVLRADSAYYNHDVIAAARRHRTHFSITARKDRAVTAAIGEIPDDAWTTIHYPRAVFDDQLGQWVSDAGVAQIPFTAFASRGRAPQVTARLIVRRVRDANPEHVHAQGELFWIWRHHAIFTDSPLPMLTAEADHRRHAIPSSPSRAARSRNGSGAAPGDGYS